MVHVLPSFTNTVCIKYGLPPFYAALHRIFSLPGLLFPDYIFEKSFFFMTALCTPLSHTAGLFTFALTAFSSLPSIVLKSECIHLIPSNLASVSKQNKTVITIAECSPLLTRAHPFCEREASAVTLGQWVPTFLNGEPL